MNRYLSTTQVVVKTSRAAAFTAALALTSLAGCSNLPAGAQDAGVPTLYAGVPGTSVGQGHHSHGNVSADPYPDIRYDGPE